MRSCLPGCQVFVDTVGPADKYQDKLSKLFPGVAVTVRPKADALFPIVSAASICAKVSGRSFSFPLCSTPPPPPLLYWLRSWRWAAGSAACLCPAGGQRLRCETLAVRRGAGGAGRRLRLRIPRRYRQPFMVPHARHLSAHVREPHADASPSAFADPKTKAWLLRYLDPVFGYPQLVRFSWSTARTLMDSRGVAVRW